MSAEAILSIDIGGKSIKTGYVGPHGLIKALEPCALPNSLQEDTVAKVLHEAVIKSLAKASTDGLEIVAVGVGSPGLVDRVTGHVREATNLRWGSFALGDFLGERTGKPVFVEHDVASGAIAERQFGALRGVDDYLYVAIGTGIASAISIGGRIHHGATGLAGELGHTIVRENGRECGCGRLGCLEAYCSAKHIELRYQEETGNWVACADIADRARSGDACAASIWDDATSALALALVNCHMLFEPAIVVLGGGVSASGEDLLLRPVERKMRELAPDMAIPDIRFSQLHEHAGLIGAGYQAWDRFSRAGGETA